MRGPVTGSGTEDARTLFSDPDREDGKLLPRRMRCGRRVQAIT